MIYKVIIIFLIATLLAPHFFAQQQSSPKAAYKLKDVTEFGCCGIDLELSILIAALRNEPEARAHIIGYSGPGDPPGKLLRYLRYIEINLPDFMGDNAHPASVVSGGRRDQFTIDMWIVPKGASVPMPDGLPPDTNPDTSLPYKFDEAGALVMEYNEESYLSFGLACTLTYPDWKEFFRILQDRPDLRGHIIIYIGHDDRTQERRRIGLFLRDFLKESYAEEVKELKMAYGGRREWSQIEIWLVPKGKPDPAPTPVAKSAMAR